MTRGRLASGLPVFPDLLDLYGALLHTAPRTRELDPRTAVPATHLRRVDDLRMRLGHLKRAAAEAWAFFDALPIRLAFVSSDFKIEKANRAWSIDSDARLVAELLAPLAAAGPSDRRVERSGRAVGEVQLFTRPQGGRVGVLLLPLSADFIDKARGWLVVLGPHTSDPSGAGSTLLRELFGLTLAESTIALLLLDGTPSREIARRRGTTIQTVRGQIKSVLQKTASPTRSCLIRLLTELGPADPGPG